MGVRYTTLERIAVGGMGEVFLARQEGMGGFRRTVVLKRLLPQVEGDEDAMHRFLDEARVAAALSHENVVSILEVGDDDGPFLALEYVHGENAGALRRLAKKKEIRFPIVVVARIIADAARGLAHAHDAHDVDGRPLRIVHRDVAPKNIFVRTDGVSKIGDFGIAKSEHRLSHTATGQVPGTLSYMAPEQARGDETTAAADQFSLGIVLWELLVGEPLFKAHSPQDTLRRVLARKVPPPSSKRADAAPLDKIVMRMLDRNPGKRYRSLADVAAAIEATLPETRAELGQRAVAAFVEAVAGDALRERQERIEAGPDQTMRVVRDYPPITSSSSGRERTPSATPVTRSVFGGTEAITKKDRPAPGPNKRAAPRRLVAALSGAALCAAAVCAVVFLLLRAPSAQERTDAYLDTALVENPIVHRAVFLAMADMAHVDEHTSAAVADRLIALLRARLKKLRGHGSDAGAVDEARAVLKDLGNAKLATEELDMWDYDSSAPVRWLPPDTPEVIQQGLAQGGLEYLRAQAELRRRAVDHLIDAGHKDRAVVHGLLDPLVLERERLIEQATTAPAGDLLALFRRIAALKDAGKARLTVAVGAPLGAAIADIAFHTVSSPDDFDPLYEYPPSTWTPQAGQAPATH